MANSAFRKANFISQTCGQHIFDLFCNYNSLLISPKGKIITTKIDYSESLFKDSLQW